VGSGDVVARLEEGKRNAGRARKIGDNHWRQVRALSEVGDAGR
jgi:hypothetical protein